MTGHNPIDNGGPAFPNSAEMMSLCGGKGGQGMSLRDWYAGMALQGLLAAAQGPTICPAMSVETAFVCADAMIKAPHNSEGAILQERPDVSPL